MIMTYKFRWTATTPTFNRHNSTVQQQYHYQPRKYFDMPAEEQNPTPNRLFGAGTFPPQDANLIIGQVRKTKLESLLLSLDHSVEMVTTDSLIVRFGVIVTRGRITIIDANIGSKQVKELFASQIDTDLLLHLFLGKKTARRMKLKYWRQHKRVGK